MKFVFIIVLLALTGCGRVSGLNLGQYPDPHASPSAFTLCHGYGCTSSTRIGFHQKDWKKVTAIFKRPAKTAKIERERIAKAIARMEYISGELAGTQDDLPKAPLKRQSMKELDCVDETVNTTKYLGFMVEEGLLKFHTVGKPAYKGLLLNGVYPHNTATIKEIETGQVYVVDSYIFANGKQPVIRTLEDWLLYKTFESAEN